MSSPAGAVLPDHTQDDTPLAMTSLHVSMNAGNAVGALFPKVLQVLRGSRDRLCEAVSRYRGVQIIVLSGSQAWRSLKFQVLCRVL